MSFRKKLTCFLIGSLTICVLAFLWQWQWAATIPEIDIPAAPQPPSPNAYDFYVKASRAIYPSKPPPGDRQSEDLVPREMRIAATPLTRKEAWLARNAKALNLLHQGFQYPCRVPTNRQGQVKGQYTENLRIRALAEVVQVEIRVNRKRGRALPSAQSALDLLKLGHDLAHGGTSLNQTFSVSINAMGRYELWLTLPQLKKTELDIVTKRFHEIARQREPLSEIIREDNYSTLAMLKNGLPQQRAFDREISWHLPRQLYRQLKEPLRLEFKNTVRLTKAFQEFATQPYPNKLDISLLPNDYSSQLGIENFESTRLTYARDQTGTALLHTALALESYRFKHGYYPAAIGELVPQELPEVPRDPFKPERRLTYKKSGTKYVLYSVGPDGRDDGGKVIDNQKSDDPWLAKYHTAKQSQGDFVLGTNY